jgi:putative ABC transport system permease protein
MKYLPLIWAALWRKPVRSILTFVSVMIGLTLFGLTIGVNAGFRHLADTARADRIYVSSRYSGALTLAQRDQIALLSGVTHVGVFGMVAGYHQAPANSIAVMMVDPEMHTVFSELSVSAALWRRMDETQNGIVLSRTLAARYGVRTGDAFPVIAAQPKADGSAVWNFTVLGIVDDISYFPAGFSVGNYAYLDQARPLSQRGTGGQFWLLIRDSSRAEQASSAIDAVFANSPVPTRSDSEKAIMENAGGPDSIIAIGTESVAAIGMLMIAFLTSNAIAQSVRERIPEFAVLKTIGFTARGIIALVFAEAAIPCLFGAAVGLALAKVIAVLLPRFVPAVAAFPSYMSTTVVASAFLGAGTIAFCSTALPALRIARLDVATALARR